MRRQCGAGITKGYTLNFSFVYASGSPSLTQEITAEVADWAQIGIKVDDLDRVIQQRGRRLLQRRRLPALHVGRRLDLLTELLPDR